MPRYLSAQHLRTLVSGAAAVEALEASFLSRPANTIEQVSRVVVEHELGDFLLMPAAGPEGAGAKLVSVVPGNPERGLPLISGLYVLFSQDGLMPELLIDGAGLTQLRTAAVSAMAARHLARPDSRRMVVFGAGPQAEAHIRVMREVLPIEQVTIVGRTPQSRSAGALAEQLRGEGIAAVVGGGEAVATADLVCTCTTSLAPVFDSSLLAPGAHVSAIGSYKPEMRELDFALCERALLVVETRDSARKEAGDIIQALEAGALPQEDFGFELLDLLRGEVRRATPEQVSVFKSVGLPSEDLVVARTAAGRLDSE